MICCSLSNHPHRPVFLKSLTPLFPRWKLHSSQHRRTYSHLCLWSQKRKNPTPKPSTFALEHLFQEIHFQHFVIYTKRDEFLRRHIAKGHCGTDPSETNNFSKSGYREGKRRRPGAVRCGAPRARRLAGPPHPDGSPMSWPNAGGGHVLQNHGFGKNMASRQVNCFAKGSFLS